MSTNLGSILSKNHDNVAKQILAQESNPSDLERDELQVRHETRHNWLYLLTLDSYAAFFVFIRHLICTESLVSIGLSVGLTIYVYGRVDDNDNFDGNSMNWVLLSFAVITPISSAIRMAFSRREMALTQLATMRATFVELYTAHAIWDWGKESGRKKSNVNWLEHSDKVIQEITCICKEMTRALTLPSFTRARHKVTYFGRKEADHTIDVVRGLETSVNKRFGRLAELCEIVKYEGLPPNEATRVRQWERILLQAIENLRYLKRYRTPQGLRSFSRIFSMFLPPFYAPYYAQLAKDADSLGLAIAFSAITAIALTALFQTTFQLEDPFVQSDFLDSINVKLELLDELTPHLLELRQQFFPEAEAYVKI